MKIDMDYNLSSWRYKELLAKEAKCLELEAELETEQHKYTDMESLFYEAKEALEFYADPRTYEQSDCNDAYDVCDIVDDSDLYVIEDENVMVAGKRASGILEKIKDFISFDKVNQDVDLKALLEYYFPSSPTKD